MSVFEQGNSSATGARQYHAPALEKGLDILEALAEADGPMTLSAVSKNLSRSMNELFRMFQVLIDRGYLAPALDGTGYELSTKLLTIARSSHVLRQFVNHALPHMRSLAESTELACHVSAAADDQLVVIASVDAPAAVNFSVRPGFRSHMTSSAAGKVLFGLETMDMRDRLSPILKRNIGDQKWSDFYESAEEARRNGFSIAQSEILPGVTDISGPVFDELGIKGVLTVPFMHSGLGLQISQVSKLVAEKCAEISRELGAKGRVTVDRLSLRPTAMSQPLLKLVR
ncbi:IclR family transcriptional regulator [Asticcacaulis benevestitus]|uniref:IclR family transcriptional regulator n=1 Tax=Asticcacaulis benevestitus DSM 16100 = ATCC BAA-896 TaxID=1121022 RepID=V4PLZ5_9CAUL|nr:helix-turn-helix domain-containing protein [Asticcacaulis benevestitus]ESQ86490.1 hypothetical protein ABENE_18375 [Asticcacaulis benevestitus DSM 16100 = ATCC BAA-896]